MSRSQKGPPPHLWTRFSGDVAIDINRLSMIEIFNNCRDSY